MITPQQKKDCNYGGEATVEKKKNDNELKHIPTNCCECTKCERDGIVQEKVFKHPCTGKNIGTPGIDCKTCNWGDGETGCGIKKFFGVN